MYWHDVLTLYEKQRHVSMFKFKVVHTVLLTIFHFLLKLNETFRCIEWMPDNLTDRDT